MLALYSDSKNDLAFEISCLPVAVVHATRSSLGFRAAADEGVLTKAPLSTNLDDAASSRLDVCVLDALKGNLQAMKSFSAASAQIERENVVC